MQTPGLSQDGMSGKEQKNEGIAALDRGERTPKVLPPSGGGQAAGTYRIPGCT